MTILSAFWTLDASGNWSDGGNWSTEVQSGNSIVNEPIPPPNGYNVQITPGGNTPFTVTYDTTADENTLTGQFGATFDMVGGALTIDNSSTWSSNFLLNAGTLQIDNGWSIDGGFQEAAGATVDVAGGALAVSTGTIAGTNVGAGDLYLEGGNTFTLASTAVIDTGTLELGVTADGFGSVTTLTTGFTYGGLFLLDNYSGNDATLDLNGKTLTLSGEASLDADVNGPGLLRITGSAAIADGGYSQLSMTGGARLSVSGTATQYQNTDLSAGLTVTSTGTWNMVADNNIFNDGGGTITNQGLLEKTGGANTSTISTPTTNLGTILVDSGTLQFNGNLTSNGSHSLLAGPGTLVDNGTFSSTGSIDLGALILNGGGTLGGTTTVDVTGLLAFDNAAYSLNANTKINAGTIAVQSGTLTFKGAETITSPLNVTYGTLNLGSFASRLTGPTAFFDSTIGGSGTLTVTDVTSASGLTVYGTEKIVDAGTITQTGGAQLGASSTDHVTLAVNAGATYDIATANWLGNPNINDTGTATITNAGLFEMTGAGTSTVWHANVTNSGTILVAGGGVLDFAGGTDTLGGTLAGAGELVLGTAWTLTATTRNVTVGTLDNQGVGTLTHLLNYSGTYINDFGSTLDLNGQSLTLGGAATLDASLLGGTGTVTMRNATLNGGAAFYGTVTVIDSHLVTQTGGAQLGASSTDAVTLDVNSGATYDITGSNWLGNPNINDTGTATISNAGLFEQTGSGTSTVWHANFTNTGTLLTAGTLYLSGGSASLGGTLAGGGYLGLDTNWTFSASSVTLGTIENGGTGTLNAPLTTGAFINDNGAVLNLNHRLASIGNGSSLAGAINGAGTLKTASGSTTVGGLTVEAGAVLSNAGTVVDSGQVTLGSAAGAGTITNMIHSVYDFTNDSGINAVGSGDKITNAGLFEKTAGTGTSTITAAFSSSGTVEVTSGTLVFTGGFSSTGTIIGNETTNNGTVIITALGMAAQPSFVAPATSGFALAAPDLGATATPPPVIDAGTIDMSGWTPEQPAIGTSDALTLALPQDAIPISPGG